MSDSAIGDAEPPPPLGHADWQSLGNRLLRMHKHLGKWARRQSLSCYRLYDHDLPDQPAVIDWYDGNVVVWSKRRTRDDSDPADWARVQGLLACIEQHLHPQHIFHKRRRRQQGRQAVGEEGSPGQYGKTGEGPFHQIVSEHGLRFRLNLGEYLDVGLFLDHRPTRKMVGDAARGKRVLNLFAYTGSFSVYAAHGGALQTTTVDLSHRYLAWAEANFELNGFTVGGDHQLIRSDSLAFIAQAQELGERYDLIVCDPPTFSNSKSLSADFSVDRDHTSLLQGLSEILAPDGTIIFSTNSRRFTLTLPKHLRARDLTKATTDKDFERRPAHQCWFITHAL